MAKIRNTDVAEKDVFADLRKSAEKSLEVLKEMERVLKENLTQQKNFAKGFKATNVSDIKKLAAAQNEVKKSVAGLNEIEKEKIRLEATLKKLNSDKIQQNEELKVLIAEQRKSNRELAKDSINLGNAYQKLTRQTNKAQAEFKRLAAQFGVNSKEARGAKKEFDRLDSQLRQVNNAARDGRRDVGRYGTAFSKLGGILKSGLGFVGITAGIAGITRLIGNAVNIFKDFEAANSKLQSVLGATESEMERLKVQAKELGATTSFTASQVTELQTEFAKLGFPTKEILNMTESTLAAAAAMGSGLGEQAALTGATIKAFGLASTDAARVNDVLAKSTSRSALDFSKLNASMSTIAPVASKLGFGLEDTVALLGNLSDSGFDASTAATATRNIMLKLADSSSVLGKRLKEPVRDLPSLIKGLKQLTNEGVDLSEALELTDVRSVAAFSTFLSGTESLEKLSAELNNAEGAAQKMADTMLDNLAGDITKAESAWEGFILSLEDGTGALSGIFRGVVQGFTKFLGILTKVETEIEKSIVALEKEQAALTSLQIEINTTNINSQRRIEMVRQLKEEYPDLLEFIDAETASNEDLQVALDKVNQSVRTRMLIQKAAQKSDDLQALSTARRKQAEELLNDILIEGTELLFEKGKADLLRGKTIEEQVKIIEDEAGAFSSLGIKISRYNGILEESDKWQKVTNEEKEKSKKVIQELISNGGDLNELTTQELKNLIKTGVLTDKKLNRQAREIIITRELKDVKKLDKEVTDEQNKSNEKGNKLLGEKVSKIKELVVSIRSLTKAEIEAAEEERKRREAEKKAEEEALKKRFGATKTPLKDLDAANARTIKREEEIAKRRAEIREKGLNVLEALEDKYFKDQNEKADKQISETEKREKRLQELAVKGIQDARDSLAQNQKEQAEAVKKKEELRQQEKKTELALAVLKAFNAELEKGAGPSTAFAKAIASSAVLVSAISALPAFFDGTENTGNNGKGVDGKGGFLSILHPNERVVPKVINDKLDGISNEKLGELADNGLLSYALNSQNMGVKYSENSKITKELTKLQELNKSIIKAIESRPIDEGWTVDDIKKVATHTVRIGSKREKTKFKL